MTSELFQGAPADLKVKVDAIISGGATSLQVVALSDKSWYLIIYS